MSTVIVSPQSRVDAGASISTDVEQSVKSKQSIPRIIHQSWKTDQLPWRWKNTMASVKRWHPDWEYRLWTDEKADAYVREQHPDFYPIYAGFSRGIMRADVMRYILMYDQGGMYCDLDYEFIRPYNYGKSNLVLGCEFDRAFGDPRDQVANYVFASALAIHFGEIY
jgi:mannosyltransferase OCH1-like enzyme